MLRQTVVRSLKAQGKLPAVPIIAPYPACRHFNSTAASGKLLLQPFTTEGIAAARLTGTQACTCISHSPAQPQAWQASEARPRPFSFSAAARSVAEEAEIPEISSLTERQYHDIANETMDTLTDTFERVQEELGDGDEGLDVEYHSGVLTLKLPADKGTYVINKQPPNKQIWLSSPTSGPKRYDYNKQEDAWFYSRDGSRMLQLLEDELSDKLGIKVSFDERP